MSAVIIPNWDHARSPAIGSRATMFLTRRALVAMALAVASAVCSSNGAEAQDASIGQAAFATCLACHAVGAGAEHKNGPVLNGIAGKPAASAAGFTYSDAFQAAKATGLRWTDENLDKYLADPIAFMPGSHMAWAVPDVAQRHAIIAYLKTLP